MNRSTPLLLLVSILITLTLVSCGNGGDESGNASSNSQTDNSTETGSNVDSSTANRLELRLAEGETYRVRFEATEDLFNNFIGANPGVVKSSKLIYFEVIDTDRSGHFQLRGTFEEIILSGEGEDVVSEESNMMRPNVGKSFEFWVAPNGNVQDVTGFEEMFESFIEALREDEKYASLFESELPPEVAQELGSGSTSLAEITLRPLFDILIGEKTTETTLEIFFAAISEDEISAQDDSWEDSDVVAQASGVPFQSANRWTRSNPGENFQSFGLSFELNAEEEIKAMELGFGSVVYYSDISGTGSGTYQLDSETGWPQRVEVGYDYTMMLDVRGIEGFDQDPTPVSGSSEILINLVP